MFIFNNKILSFLIGILAIYSFRNSNYFYPYVLLFTGYREHAKSVWTNLSKIDTKIIYPKQHIAIIDSENYSYNLLKKTSNYWREPVVVRGLFKNTIAIKKWNDPDYLPSIIGDVEISIIDDAFYKSQQKNRSMQKFNEAFYDVIKNNNSKKYLFFPTKARTYLYKISKEKYKELENKVNNLILKDLEVNKILWKDFGTKKHRQFVGSQFIIGRGINDSDQTTGSGWHCAIGNNWFVQVIGRKRWYFLDPKYTYLLTPMRAANVAFMTANSNLIKLQKHLPVKYVDLEAGDLLYNPDWQWHSIKNYNDLTIGIPIRELNISLSIRNNLIFSMIVINNIFFTKVFKYDIGGYQS